MIMEIITNVNTVWAQYNLSALTYIHLSLFATAFLLILLIGLPLGIFASLSPRGSLVIQVLNIIEMIPDIALLLLLIPITGALLTPSSCAKHCDRTYHDQT